jgi:hypothetical protein
MLRTGSLLMAAIFLATAPVGTALAHQGHVSPAQVVASDSDSTIQLALPMESLSKSGGKKRRS